MASISQQQPHSSFLDWFIHQGWFLVTLTDCRLLYVLTFMSSTLFQYFKKCIMYQDHDNFIFGEMFSVIACIGQTLRSCFLNILTRIHSKKKLNLVPLQQTKQVSGGIGQTDLNYLFHTFLSVK